MSTMVEAAALEEGDRKELLRIARTTLKEFLRNGRTPPGAPHRAQLLVHAAAFVTLHVDGVLRGCIGHTEPETPLYRTILDLTVSAATRDPRFASITIAEVPATKITISVLSPRAFVPIVDVERIEVGRHGLFITHAGGRGLLLPQVPVEHGWDRATFLAETCRKAGLPDDAWRDETVRIESFTADVFSEA